MAVRVVVRVLVTVLAALPDDDSLPGASARPAHQAATSTDRIRSSRPRSSSTSALPHGHSTS
ncbi:MAG TPA: hypothetical protein VFY38_11695, partial [Pseudonocardia sp.]|nr:hypothetical protein [Pseudonocardia sp.]